MLESMLSVRPFSAKNSSIFMTLLERASEELVELKLELVVLILSPGI
jgi:hypothetical protein